MIKKVRNSNLELFRLVLMFFITMHHFLVHGLKTAGYFSNDIENISILLNSFFIVGVNCFILISGFYGIKPQFKSALNLYLTCLFYLLLGIIFNVFINGKFSIKETVFSFLPFSHSPYWFITSYFYLFLISPILNRAIENIGKKQLLFFILLLTPITFYFGLLWQGGINTNGYNVMNFIYLYLIGSFIKLCSTDRIHTYYMHITYIGAGLLLFLSAWSVSQLPFLDYKFLFTYIFTYNNPLVIIASVSIFLYFTSLKIQNNFINKIAQSALAIYLIQENPHFGKPILYPFIESLKYNVNEYFLYFILILLAVLLMIICILIDQIRLKFIEFSFLILEKIKFFSFQEKLIRTYNNILEKYGIM